jgi:hypothetical protein
MSCSTTTNTSASELLYDFSMYKVDFSSLWTILSDVPELNFPLITFNNTINSNIPVNDGQTGDTIADVFYPNFPNSLQLISPDLSAYNAQILDTTPSTITYLVGSINDVFGSTSTISYDVIYAPTVIGTATQTPAQNLGFAWDAAWENSLINPGSSTMLSYFFLMGLSYSMDIQNAEGGNLSSFTSWLNTQNVPPAIQNTLLSAQTALVSGGDGASSWQPEYNYSSQGFTPYNVDGVFFGIQHIEVNPNWSCYNPYALLSDTAAVSGFAPPTSVFGVPVSGGEILFSNPAVSWTKYQNFPRPRLDAMRAYGRMIVPDNIELVISGTFTTTAAAISGSRVYPISIPYGQDITQSIKAPYGVAFTPVPTTIAPSANWNIQTTVLSNNWIFDNTHSGPQAAYDTNFTLNIITPIDLINDLNRNPSLGSQVITINWTGQFFAPTSVIYPYLYNLYFSPLYSSCDIGGQVNKAQYVPGVGIMFDVQSFTNGSNTIPANLTACKNDILAIYNNYSQYACDYSIFAEYGDILNIHGRYFDQHGAEFFGTASQVLRPQEYLPANGNDVEIIDLGVIVNLENAQTCNNGMLYNADTLNTPCPTTPVMNVFTPNAVPIQNSSTSVSLNSRLNALNGKLCSVLPGNITQVPNV